MLATATISLEQQLENVERLPAELQKNFSAMRTMDTKTKKLSQKIDSESDAVLRKKLLGPAGSKEIAKIQRMYTKLQKHLDEKVQLAVQTYELVDKHIRHLDSDLSRYQSECQESEKQAETKPVSRTSSSSKKSTSMAAIKKKKRRAVDSSEDEKPRRRAERVVTPEPPEPGNIPSYQLAKESGEVFDMPVDPNEPTYCLCQQVSYGDMIGCDNPDCPIEWFHFPCVGLVSKPKGNWYCPRCSEERKKKK